MTLPHGDEHDQVVKTENEDHTIKDTEGEVFGEGIAYETVDGAQDDYNIRCLGGLDPEIIDGAVMPEVVQGDFEVLVAKPSLGKGVSGPELHFFEMAGGIGQVGLDIIYSLIEEFEQVVFVGFGVVADTDTVPANGAELAVLWRAFQAGAELRLHGRLCDVVDTQVALRIIQVFDLGIGENVFVQ